MKSVLFVVPLFLCCIATPLIASEPKQQVYNHVTQEGSRLDPLILAAYADRFGVTPIGDAGYVSPRLTRGSLPKFCLSKTGEYLTGDVVVAYVISKEGRTTDWVVIESTDERLNATALASASEWQFVPAQLRGVSISTVAAQEFHFKQPPQQMPEAGMPTASAAVARRPVQEFTILGDQKILCEVEGQTPLPATGGGITIRQPASVAREGEFAYQFALDSSVRVSRIVVEDVSGASARLLLEDSAPKIESAYWMGVSVPTKLSKRNLPWIFDKGDSTRVFRFTIWISDAPDPVILYQPVVWMHAAKNQLKKLAK